MTLAIRLVALGVRLGIQAGCAALVLRVIAETGLHAPAFWSVFLLVFLAGGLRR